MKQELGPNQKRWIAALRSGRYAQGKRVLRKTDDRVDAHCCLGVGCRIFRIRGSIIGPVWGYGKSEQDAIAPNELVEKLALHNAKGWIKGRRLCWASTLAGANDEGATFKEIADFCEKYPHSVFSEPR